jgi:hypothetical protein
MMIEQWLLSNWQYVLVGFYIPEKVVKLTPTKYDDILFDVVGGAIKKLVKK